MTPRRNIRRLERYRVKRTPRLLHAPHWHKMRRYASAAFCVYLAVLCVGILEVVTQQQTLDRYRLDALEQQILGHDASASITSKLKFDAQSQAYQFNAGYTPASNAATVGGADYTAMLPTDTRTGAISLTDPSSQITVALKPQFESMPAKAQGGRVIYPLMQGGATMVYSVKSNGLKEDIIIPGYMGDELQFHYTLSLPAGVEARLTSDGDVGIYTGNPALFGNVSTGSSKDKALLDKARANSPKTNLAFIIPAPTVKGATGTSLATARFQLKGSELTVEVKNLQKASYPLSVDPSLVLPGGDGWAAGNDEDNTIDYSTSGQIGGPPLTGGALKSRSNLSHNLTTARFKFASTVYNGRLYVLGGVNSSNSNIGSIEYATLSGSGDVGTWTQSTVNAPCNCFLDSVVAYDGYMYMIGGNWGGGLMNPINYIKINSDGSLASTGWVSGPTPNVPRQSHGAVAYDGYVYIFGGSISGGATTNTMEYAKINTDGSLTSWTKSTTTMISPLMSFGYTVYDGYLYVGGGYTANSTGALSSAVDYIRLGVNGDTSIGNGWAATSGLDQAMFANNMFAYGGFVYTFGGCYDDASAVGDCQDSSPYSYVCGVRYAPVNADGSIGAWSSTGANAANCADYSTAIQDRGYMVTVGGCVTSNNLNHNCTTVLAGGGYTPISSAGDTGSGNSPTTTSPYSARVGAASVIANGYLYVVGGCSVSAANCNSDTTKLLGDTARLKINPDGSVGDAGCGQGAWCDDTTHLLPAAKTSSPCASTFGRSNGSLAYSNGWLYYVGGLAANGSLSCNNMQAMNDVLLVRVVPTTGALNGNWFQSGNTFDPTSQHAGSTGVQGTAALVWHDYLYVFGGNDPFWQSGAGENTSLIWYTHLNQSNGSPGAFTTNANNMPDFLSGASVVVSHGYLVVMGGYGAYGGPSSAKANVWTVKMPAAGGAIPAFSGTPTSTMPGAWYQGIGWTVGDRIYYAGGGDGSNVNSAIYSAAVASDGSIGSWMTATNALPNARNRSSGDYAYGRVFVTGGCIATSCTPTNSTDTVPINYGGLGSPTSFVTNASTLNSSRMRTRTVVTNGYMYVIGGCPTRNSSGCTSVTGSVEYAPVNADGSLGTWKFASGLTSREFFSAFTYDGYIYVAGGCTVAGCGSTTNAIQYAKPGSDGNITGWSTNPVDSIGTFGDRLLAVNGYVYEVTSSGAYYAQIDAATHQIGSFAATATPVIAAYHAELVSNGSYIYRIAGRDSSTGDTTNTVEYAPINADHSLGAWQLTTSMLSGREDGVAAGIANGYMYVVGGFSTTFGSTEQLSDYAPIMADGSLGKWQVGPLLATTRDSLSGVVYNGHVYAVSGNVTSTTLSTTIEYATLQTPPRVAHYSKLFTTDKYTMPVNYFVTSAQQAGGAVVTLSYQTATATSLVYGAESSVSGIASGTKYPVTISGDGVSYYLINLAIDDTVSASFGSSPTSISYFQLNYHPNPSMRLRGGQTFNANKLQGLDAP